TFLSSHFHLFRPLILLFPIGDGHIQVHAREKMRLSFGDDGVNAPATGVAKTVLCRYYWVKMGRLGCCKLCRCLVMVMAVGVAVDGVDRLWLESGSAVAVCVGFWQ
ncbi:hypothetical protein Tsubulata_009975, partial [Turnera subulata]